MTDTRYIKETLRHERAGHLAKALLLAQRATNAPSYNQMQGVLRANVERLLQTASRKARCQDRRVVVVHEGPRNPNNYTAPTYDRMQAPLVSLTTISSRIARVAQTIATIQDQTLKPHSVNLYISDEPYLLDNGIPRDSRQLREIASIGANIYRVANIGPYRKQYPIIWQLRKRGADRQTPVITIDDDVLYPNNIIEKLMEAMTADDAVVAHRGRQIVFNEDGIASYRDFVVPQERRSFLNIANGRNGIAYRLGYFPEDQQDFVGPFIAPTADDIWCKWVTAVYCIPTIVLAPTACIDPSVDFAHSEQTDTYSLFHKHNASGTNDEAISALELYFSMRKQGIARLYGPNIK